MHYRARREFIRLWARRDLSSPKNWKASYRWKKKKISSLLKLKKRSFFLYGHQWPSISNISIFNYFHSFLESTDIPSPKWLRKPFIQKEKKSDLRNSYGLTWLIWLSLGLNQTRLTCPKQVKSGESRWANLYFKTLFWSVGLPSDLRSYMYHFHPFEGSVLYFTHNKDCFI